MPRSATVSYISHVILLTEKEFVNVFGEVVGRIRSNACTQLPRCGSGTCLRTYDDHLGHFTSNCSGTNQLSSITGTDCNSMYVCLCMYACIYVLFVYLSTLDTLWGMF